MLYPCKVGQIDVFPENEQVQRTEILNPIINIPVLCTFGLSGETLML